MRAMSKVIILLCTVCLISACSILPNSDTHKATGGYTGLPAPEFALKYLNQDEEFQMSSMGNDNPTVLMFGSMSCPIFYRNAEQEQKLYEQYGDNVNFLMIYVNEAHSIDGNRGTKRGAVKFGIYEHTSYEHRSGYAELFQNDRGLTIPMVVDNMEKTAENLYAGHPNRIILLDKNKTVLLDSGRGASGYEPTLKEITAWLRKRT